MRKLTKWMPAVMLVGIILVLLFMPIIALAQDEGEGDGEKKQAEGDGGFMGLIKAGGAVGHFIIFLSFVSLALVIEHFVNIKRDKFCPPEIVAEMEALVDEGQYEDAIALCSANPCFFTNVVGAALAKVEGGFGEMEKAMGEAGENEANKVNQHISYLSLLGSIAPMLGLTGTVTGMISAFGVIKTMQSPPPSMLAKGVEEALVTTAEGLFVAMPVLASYFFFKNKVTALLIEMGMICGEFLDKFKGMEPAK
ncbi:MAG: MotA/TolQ/ExbB proton channel family protein [Planctomycetes bacterium]|nr:MotA/TolQ/ExbB proton channel family protein [Planctomycetota bacterium]